MELVTEQTIFNEEALGNEFYNEYIKTIFKGDLDFRKSLCEGLKIYLEEEIKYIEKIISEKK